MRRMAVRYGRAVGWGWLLLAAACGDPSQPESSAGTSGPGAAATQPASDRTPTGQNLILITVDTLRYDHLGCYGYPRATSPAIDRLAARSVLFEHAAVQWPKTTPSLTSMLTSLYGCSNGVMRHCAQPVPDRHDLLAERLKAAGYATVGAVSQGNLDRDFGFDQGFDVYHEVWKLEERARVEASGPVCPARSLTEYALQGVDERVGEGPLFLWAHYIDVHSPYEPPEPYHEMFVGDEWFDETNTARFGEGPNIHGSMGQINATTRVGDEQRVDYYIAQYDAEIVATDEQIQNLLDGLEERGLLKDAVVVFTADHGESLGDHNFYFEHGMLPYDACTRVPLLIAGPGIEPRLESTPVGLIDLLPTVLDLLGLPAAGPMQGASLRPLLEQREDAAASQFVFTESGYEEEYQRAIRNDRWKLVYVPTPKMRRRMTGASFELYDLVADPAERVNVADRYPAVVEGLRGILLRWIRRMKQEVVVETVAQPELDPATLEHLRKLGYVR